MPKAYWIAQNTVLDAEAYKTYQAANAAPFAEFGARFLVRAGQQEVREGETGPRTVVIEFPSYEAARACYDSDAYQAAKALRDGIAHGTLTIVEGYDA